MTNTKRIGPRMAQVAHYVAQHPGCQAIAAARHAGPHGSLMYGYATVRRAIRAGLVRAEYTGPRYRLFPRESAS